MAAAISMETLLKSIECLPAEQKVIVLQGLLLQNTPVAKEPVKEAVAPAKKEETKKSKKEKDPNAPKKEASWWAKASADVAKQVKGFSLLTKEDKITIPAFCSLLKDKGLVTKEGCLPTEEELRALVAEIRANPAAITAALAEKKAAKKTAVKTAVKPAEKTAEPEKPTDTFTFEGKVYNTKGEKPEQGCFLYIGEECAGFFFNGKLDTNTMDDDIPTENTA